MQMERDSIDNGDYNDWVITNEADILTNYSETLDDFPDDIYEGVLDDDYEDAEAEYVNNLTIDDVPDDFIVNMYNCGGEE